MPGQAAGSLPRQSFPEERLLIENASLAAELSVAEHPRMTKVHAIASTGPLPIEDPASLIDIELDLPEPGPNDLRVRIEAVSVNPVDVRRRKSTTKVPPSLGTPHPVLSRKSART